MKQASKIVGQLNKFGLSEKEARIYLHLLELGPTSIQEVAKYSGFNRTTTHFICEKLKKTGFIGETVKGKKRIIFAEDPDKFTEVVKEAKEDVREKEEALKSMLEILKTQSKIYKHKPKVRFYEGEEGFFEVCKRSLDKAKDEILFLSSMKDFREVGSEFDTKYYIPRRVREKIKMRALVFKNKITLNLKKKGEKELREVRFFSDKHKFQSTMFIYGNEFSMITSHAPFLGVVIESVELTEFMRNLFESSWEHAEK